MAPHQIAEIGDEQDSPYRAYILPLAKKQIGLLYAVLGLSAVHLGRLTDDRTLIETTSVEYRLKAIRALSEQVRKGQNTSLSEEEEDCVFATIQVMLLHDVSLSFLIQESCDCVVEADSDRLPSLGYRSMESILQEPCLSVSPC
jgi:hypothetical protein